MPILTYVIISIIAFFSFISITVILERLFFFTFLQINYRKYKITKKEELIELKHKLNDKKKKNSLDIFLLEILNYQTITKDEIKEMIDGYYVQSEMHLSKRVDILGTIARISTLLGLFGTVTGMIFSFQRIVESGTSTASVVADGISSALFTTALGLAVAIPSTFFHDFFQKKVLTEIAKLETLFSKLLSLLFQKNARPK